MTHNQKPQGEQSEQDARTDAAPRLKGSSAAAASLTPAEDRRWATLSHFGALIGCFPALAIYLVYRDRGPFTAQESKEALNFTLPLTAVMLGCYILALIPAIGWIFGLLAVLIWITMTISGLVAGIQCNKGRPYRYPLNLRLIH
ncbi:hypothetical protein BG28_04165 [Nesterenkonia sp. AN1]|uniref:Tic20 family protein n=1 Tax=Nesterenkonia aurantiaca TaxID=1436010 RepID=A0A4R7FX40_9MICC|nr:MULTISPECIES: DUF4870 domain-containing protein [Nesterenkonia]EXF24629.1 hypothetical protein BG28_04165 [Nesterenkonia sp. AN1]TDS83389.1 hypothetical protein EV640_11043 [Nesterenkonia aurantiaca]